MADTISIARIQLRKLRIRPIRIREKKETAAQQFSLRRRIPEKNIVIFTRQFATMINAGLPLVQCLGILAPAGKPGLFQGHLPGKGDVESGQSLAEGLEKTPKGL